MSVSLMAQRGLLKRFSRQSGGKKVSGSDFEAFMKMALVSAPNGIEDKVKIVLS